MRKKNTQKSKAGPAASAAKPMAGFAVTAQAKMRNTGGRGPSINVKSNAMGGESPQRQNTTISGNQFSSITK